MSLQLVYDGGSEAEFDIVAIHGLDISNYPIHAMDTWRKPSGAAGNLWLRDDLPKRLPLARVFVFTYDSKAPYTPLKHISQATRLLEALASRRDQCPSRPLLLMGHDVGGLLIKQALVTAASTQDPRYHEIMQAVFAIVFFGTPHTIQSTTQLQSNDSGFFSKLFYRLFSCGGASRSPSSRDLLKILSQAGMLDYGLEEEWKVQVGRYRYLSCVETINPAIPRASAILGLASDRETILEMVADHNDICRFGSPPVDSTGDNVGRSNLDDLLWYLSEFCRAAKRAKPAPGPYPLTPPDSSAYLS